MSRRARVLVIIGTRPEAIKLCPVVKAFRERAGLDVRVCATAQHRALLDGVLSTFGVTPDADLDIMRPGQTPLEACARMLAALDTLLADIRPDLAIVQGDTVTTFAGALACFYRRVPVGHVEAGLRTWDLQQPFPEEANRVLTSRIASLHFAPTEWAAANLRSEGVPASAIHVTGNTSIDAVLLVRDWLESGELAGADLPGLDPERKLILVTAHRRESFGEPFERICAALARLASRRDVQIVYPVHPNPSVREPVERLLAGVPNVLLTAPLEYAPFVDLMRRAYLILTDSGGIQEEAPTLGKPVLVLREKTERPEAVLAGTVKLAGTCVDTIVCEATRLLDDPAAHKAASRVHNPYGDGRASCLISDLSVSFIKNNPVNYSY
ncbi:MAG: non-hydrolyzing UDP-N-acetylglucosamine 2-epimerase [bacterium]